ncbi:MAG TPA: peptidoglycan DD-metalloendopeptidase family protein [Chitinispirillaceae bacterium]|nr:peptidoglycan DD-metalloendopeptidase family protein [Chitinispirillaceae bacterium]
MGFLHMIYLLIALVLTADAQNFIQKVSVDTSIQMLENTPHYFGSQAIRAHRRIEQQIADGTFSLKKDLYMIFRYRTGAYIPFWLKIIEENPKNDLLKIWFINAVEQMDDTGNLCFISPFLNSTNDIIRESAVNAYGFLAGTDSIAVLSKLLETENNNYVKETIKASINAIRSGGYKNNIDYLPKCYSSDPKKLSFFYNVDVMSSDKYRYSNIDTTTKYYKKTSCLIFPTQQFFYRIKYAPRAGTFNNQHGQISHVGYDGAWFFEGLPVHSISNGIVKGTMHDLSWGNLIAIESCIDYDTLTVIYGHLSRYISVSAGDSVYTGQKIGQVGNSVSYENGGYWSHVHLGIIKKPFKKANLVGYDFDADGYEDPIKFISQKESE